MLFLCHKAGEKMAGNIKGITIEIGGDTTQLEKALKNVNSTSKDLNKQLREVNNSLKFNPGNSDLLAQKQRVLAESVDNTKKKLETLKTAQEQAKEALARGDIGQEKYDALTREIIKTENQLKSLEGQLKTTNSKWREVSDTMTKAGDKMTKVGTAMTKGVTAPIAAIGGLSIAAFKEVDNGLDTVISKTGATGEAAKSLEESFRNVASNMPASFDEVGNAIGEINTQFGLTGEELEKASEKMIKFAQINGSDVTNSTINAKQAIEKYNLSAKDLDMVLDSVTKTAQNTGVSTDKLFDIVIKGSPQLKELGLNFAQATELMGRMEQKGIDSNKALSYLTRAQTNWAKEGKSVTQGLQEMQEKLASATTHEEKLAIAAEAFGTKGGAFMLEVLESGALNADDFANAMENAAGSVDSTWEGMLDPIDLVKQAMNNLKLTGAELGTSLQTVLLPIIQGAIEKFQAFANWFGNLDPQIQNLIVKVGLIAAAIGPVLVIAGKIAGLVGILSGAIGVMGGATAGATPAMLALGKAFGFISAGFKGLIGLIAANPVAAIFIAIFAAVAIAAITHWDWVKEHAIAAWNSIKTVVEGIWNGLKATAVAVFNALKSAIESAWNAIKSTTTSVWNAIKGAIEGVWNGLKAKATEIFTAIKTAVEQIWNEMKAKATEIWNAVKGEIEGIWNTIKSSAENIFNGLKTTIDGIWEGIKSATTTAWNAVKTAIETPINAAKEAVSNAINKIKSILSGSLPFPKIKLPHFKISGSFSLKPPSVPHFGVDWYDKGGIFSSPSIIGVGEKRPEFVGALDDLKTIVADVVAEAGGIGQRQIIIQQMTVRDESDIKRIARELYNEEKRNSRGRGLVV